MAEIEIEEAVGFPVMCHLVTGNQHRVAASSFSIYIAQLYKEDCAILWYVWLSDRSSPQYQANSYSVCISR